MSNAGRQGAKPPTFKGRDRRGSGGEAPLRDAAMGRHGRNTDQTRTGGLPHPCPACFICGCSRSKSNPWLYVCAAEGVIGAGQT